MIAFTTVNLTPDLAQLAAWLITEALAWLQSAAPALAITTIGLGCFVVLAGLFLMAEQVLTWAVRQ